VDETFCLSEYRNILASMLVSQTVVINTGNLFDTYCPDIFISLYGNDELDEADDEVVVV
jgi:hypothetical protein